MKYPNYLQWTRTQELWEATSHLTTNTIWYPTLHSRLFHYQSPTYFAFNYAGVVFLKIVFITWTIIIGSLPCEYDKPPWKQGSSALCHLHGQVCVFCIQKYSRYSTNPLSSEGAPPGANGHPVPITYEGFNLLTDNYNNYFMSSFIPQVNRTWKLKIISSPSSTTTWREAARPTRSNWSFCPTGCKLTSFSGGLCQPQVG